MRASSSCSVAFGAAQGELGAGVCVQSCSRGRQSLLSIICPESVCVRLEIERDARERSDEHPVWLGPWRLVGRWLMAACACRMCMRGVSRELS